MYLLDLPQLSAGGGGALPDACVEARTEGAHPNRSTGVQRRAHGTCSSGETGAGRNGGSGSRRSRSRFFLATVEVSRAVRRFGSDDENLFRIMNALHAAQIARVRVHGGEWFLRFVKVFSRNSVQIL